MIDLGEAYRGKQAFVTGHNGFKGKWLCRALEKLGAKVHGYGHPVDDVRDYGHLRYRIETYRPAFVFHLAAQAFVPVGYRDPVGTFETNVLGTVNVLEALRAADWPCAVVIVTTDKVYGEIKGVSAGVYGEERYAFREGAKLKGRCPYSASKIAAEHAVAAYRDAYFAPRGNQIAVATARAGNVLGGGDHGEGRLVPNAIAALHAGRSISVYNPNAIRPWQYVEDVIDGYLRLGAALAVDSGRGPSPFCSAFNFGPAEHHTVLDVVEAVIRARGFGLWQKVETQMREVHELRIDSRKARTLLDWKPKWDFAQTIDDTVQAYK